MASWLLLQLQHEVQYEARSFLIDALACPCGLRLRQVAVITKPTGAQAIAAAIILSNQAPTRGPPQPATAPPA